MSKPTPTPIDHSGFQLDREAMGISAGLANGIIDNAFKAVNNIDANHDGKSDISQIVALGARTLPVLIKVESAIDFDKLETAVADMPFVKDKAILAEVIKDLKLLGAEAGKFMPATP